MGNTKSHVSKNHRPGEEMYIFRIINRTLNGLRRHREHHQSQNVDHDTERSSKCSECKGFNYQQDSLIFDSDSEMSPNAEEEILVMKSWELQHEKERLRPPTYNAEDYAMALRRWGRRPVPSISDFHGTLPSTASSSSGYVSGNGEMTLRQFTSVSELLNKLRADLRFSFPSFVQEFASAPADGITLLLETLRGVQLVQNTPPSGQNGSRIGTRRAALDELGCVECLSACAERCADVPRLLSQAQPGLLALAVCLTSSLNRSRVLALQLLTKVCQINDGHAAVSEAVSSLRLRYGEGGRFRFLAGALLAPRAAIALRVAGLSFLNAFLNTAPRTQTRLYIQAEACEAGLEPRVLQEWLSAIDDRNDEILAELLKKEVKKWTKNCVDVDTLEKRLAQAEEKCSILSNKVSILQTQIKKLQLEKLNSCNHTNFNINNNNNSKKVSSRSHDNKFKRLSSNGEDEGISSSERSSTPENPCKNRENPSKIQDNDQETTIDDVIEELRILVKDAEEEDRASLEHHNNEGKNFDNAVDKTMKNNVNNDYQDKRNSALKNEDKKSKEAETDHYACVNKISKEECKRGMKKNNSPSSALKAVESDSLKIFVKDAEKLEDEIVPAILYPQPPRRTLPCFSSVLAARHDEFLDHLTPAFNSHNNDDDDDAEEETVGDDSDSLLSASKLKYNNKNECFNLEEYKHCFGKNRVEPKGSFKKQRNISKNIHDSTALNHQNFKVQELRENYKQSKFNGLKKNERQKYNGKTNIVQRSLSQDYMTADSLIYDYQQPGHGIEGRIKKFESLNVFDSSNFNNNLRNDRGELRSGRRQSDDIKLTRKIRRSESCHQVFHEARSINNSDKGGSDSGLHYITEYDSQSITTDFLNSETIEQSNNHFSVSLNEIGTSFNSMVDIVTDNSAIKNKLASERIQSKNRNAPIYSTKKYTDKVTDDNHHSHLKSDNFHTEIYSSSRVKNDKSYREKYSHRNQNQHIYRNHFMNDFNSSNNLPVSSSMNCEKSKSKKFSFIDPVMYLPSSGRPHDAFNIGKNRCNAGKYSGNPPLTSNRGIKKNTSSASCPKRGKVTDILSGLY